MHNHTWRIAQGWLVHPVCEAAMGGFRGLSGSISWQPQRARLCMCVWEGCERLHFIKLIPSSGLSLSPPPNGIIHCSLILFGPEPSLIGGRRRPPSSPAPPPPPPGDVDLIEATDNWFHRAAAERDGEGKAEKRRGLRELYVSGSIFYIILPIIRHVIGIPPREPAWHAEDYRPPMLSLDVNTPWAVKCSPTGAAADRGGTN